ncbi:MAG: hypothetical protein B7733_11695 [Myxococcales bacterium FL481]|nr:MAG: hypothetical protein B7733_11695 [Myxococcales bacterium FL481]
MFWRSPLARAENGLCRRLVPLCLAVTGACSGGHEPPVREPTRARTPPWEPPSDRAGILRALAPMPDDSVVVVYAVEGPGGLTGTMELLARAGGYRRENWNVQLPLKSPDTSDKSTRPRAAPSSDKATRSAIAASPTATMPSAAMSSAEDKPSPGALLPTDAASSTATMQPAELSPPTGAPASTPSINVRMTVIETPDRRWQARDGEASEPVDAPLGALAQAYLDLDPRSQRRVAKTLARWQADLAAARREHPGPRETVLGIDCLALTVAEQELCLWEEADIALVHRANGIKLRARSVERSVELGAHAFVIPGHETPPPLTEPALLEAKDAMRRLAEGRYASLALRRYLREPAQGLP